MVTSMVWGERIFVGLENCEETASLSREELAALFATPFDLSPAEGLPGFLASLAREIDSRREGFIAAMDEETGFSRQDVVETFDAVLTFLREFQPATGPIQSLTPAVGTGRKLDIISVPWGTVVAILPLNASLILGVTCLVNGLAAGNRVVLRPPAKAVGSAALLAESVIASGPLAERISILAVSAKDLLEEFYAAPIGGLVHYFGGSGRIPELVGDSFRGGKMCLADGQGNTWVYIGEGTDPAWAASMLAAGATRYGGQTCTSANGAIVHPSVYPALLPLLIESVTALAGKVGHLADTAYAQFLVEEARLSGGEIMAGGQVEGSALSPTLVVEPELSSNLVREGVFGPVLWVSQGTEQDFVELWPHNRFPLCAGVCGHDPDPVKWSAQLANLARIVLNGDPSVEDVFEPWGGYPAAGNGMVVRWQDKYSRTVQVDR